MARLVLLLLCLCLPARAETPLSAEADNAVRAAAALSNLAAFLVEAEEIDAAIGHLERAAGLAARAEGMPVQTVARRMAALADLKARRGEDDAPRKLYQTVVAMLDAGAAEAPLRLTALGNLAALHLEHGRIHAAEAGYQQALGVAEAQPEDPALAPLLIGLGEAQRRLGRTQSAERSVRRALSLLRAVDDVASPTAAAGYAALGRLYGDAGRWEEAARHLEEALSASERAVGMLGADSIGYAFELARARTALNEISTADALYLRAMRALAQGPGARHPAARRHAMAYESFILANADYLQDAEERHIAIAQLIDDQAAPTILPASKRTLTVPDRPPSP